MANTRPRFSNSDLTNAYFNAAKSTAATTGHLLLDSDDARASGARHGHILQVLDIKNDSGADGSIYLGGAFESQITDEQGNADTDFLWGAAKWDESADAIVSAAGWRSAGAKATDETFLLFANTAQDDGFVIHSERPFSCVVASVSVRATAGVFDFAYWNGTSWATLPLLTAAPDFGTVEDVTIVFGKPTDWEKTTSDAGIPDGRYAIRVRATTATAAEVTATRIYIGDVLRYPISLIDNTGAVHGHGVNWPLCAGDETPWAVFGTAASGWSVAIGTERHYSSQGLGDRR